MINHEKNNILHIAQNEKFIPPFIDFVYKYFDEYSHTFILFGKKEYKFGLKPEHSVQWLDKKTKIIFLIKEMHRADKIVIHGLWNTDLIKLLFLQPWLLKKCYWMIWGGDLYNSKLCHKNLLWYINEFFKKSVIKNMGFITTTIPGDYDMAVKWYDTKAKYIENLMYKSHTYRCHEPMINEKRITETIYIQIGNSADKSNNHIEIIDKLVPFVGENLKIFCPLSYGDSMNYQEKVIEYGKLKLGNIFIPMTNFMSYDDYNVYMSGIDIAIFNHNRQQAMGNIIGLLSLGKKVYINSKITPYKYFKEKGFEIFATDSEINLSKISNENANINIINSKEHFNEEILIKNWKSVFNDT